MKKKSIAAFLAMMLGPYGLHRFYLGQRVLGITYLVIGSFLTMVTILEGEPIILIAILIALIDAILFAVMPKEEFDAKYNRSVGQFSTSQFERTQGERKRAVFHQKRKAKRNKATYNYASIIEDLQEDLEDDFQQPKTHFHLACCYSMLAKSHESFFHLEKAITFGFVDFAAIHNHDDLVYVRSTSTFHKFVLNGYKNTDQLPVAEQDTLEEIITIETEHNREVVAEEEGLTLLDQIVLLGELREKGILTEEEFSNQKIRLLE